MRSVARTVGVDPSYISRVERGEKPLSDAVRERLASHYDVILVGDAQIPADVLAILNEHPELIVELRDRYGTTTA